MTKQTSNRKPHGIGWAAVAIAAAGLALSASPALGQSSHGPSCSPVFTPRSPQQQPPRPDAQPAPRQGPAPSLVSLPGSNAGFQQVALGADGRLYRYTNDGRTVEVSVRGRPIPADRVLVDDGDVLVVDPWGRSLARFRDVAERAERTLTVAERVERARQVLEQQRAAQREAETQRLRRSLVRNEQHEIVGGVATRRVEVVGPTAIAQGRPAGGQPGAATARGPVGVVGGQPGAAGGAAPTTGHAGRRIAGPIPPAATERGVTGRGASGAAGLAAGRSAEVPTAGSSLRRVLTTKKPRATLVPLDGAGRPIADGATTDPTAGSAEVRATGQASQPANTRDTIDTDGRGRRPSGRPGTRPNGGPARPAPAAEPSPDGRQEPSLNNLVLREGSGAPRIVRVQAQADRPAIGLQMAPVSEALAYHLEVSPSDAVMIAGVVEGLPAQQAGLAQFDVILGINGVEGADSQRLRAAVGEAGVGGTITLDVVSRGRLERVELRPISADLSGVEPLPVRPGAGFGSPAPGGGTGSVPAVEPLEAPTAPSSSGAQQLLGQEMFEEQQRLLAEQVELLERQNRLLNELADRLAELRSMLLGQPSPVSPSNGT